MNKQKLLAFIILSIPAFLGTFCKMKSSSQPEQAQIHFETSVKALQETLRKDFEPSIKSKRLAETKNALVKARQQYKLMEYYVEYFFPATAVMLNGAPIDEIELGENLIENPTGFQVMEEMIYSDDFPNNTDDLQNEVKKMQLNLERMLRFNAQYVLTHEQLFDAARLEIFRIISLGISGFDTPSALQSIPEAAFALQGLHHLFSTYEDDHTSKVIQNAIVYLQHHSDFNQFDRLFFIKQHLQPINNAINDSRKSRQIGLAVSGSALRDDAVDLFESHAFNLNRFVSHTTAYVNDDKILLGKKLFNDAILSTSGNRSCASCHHEGKAFTDGLAKAMAIPKGQQLLRNTPTLTYAGLQRGFFYDLKAGSLEDQALDVIHHKQEMNGSLEMATERINRSGRYQTEIRKAFKENDGTVNPWKIQHALASYIRSLAPFSSRFDAFMRNDKATLTQEEKNGFNLFMGKAKCGSCHFAPIFNGTQAPLFSKSEAEVLGVPNRKDTIKATVDPDLGRYSLYNYPQYRYAFKTPTLRNIAKTAPYMHNGVYQTLEEVLDFYNRGGGNGIGIHLKNQTLSSDPLHLTPKEIADIIAFLRTLSDE